MEALCCLSSTVFLPGPTPQDGYFIRRTIYSAAVKAKKSGLNCDDELYSELKAGRKYGKGELLTMYNQWYNRKLMTDVFPRYAQVQKVAAPKEIIKSDAGERLRSMVGSGKAKEVIFRAVNFYRMDSTFKSVRTPGFFIV